MPGLRLANRMGRISLLPYQGQQIWDAEFFGRQLAMRSMYDEPVATIVFATDCGGRHADPQARRGFIGGVLHRHHSGENR